MSQYDDGAIIDAERAAPIDEIDRAEGDSEVDFDDERNDDQLPLDEVATRESGANLDDPDELAEEEDDEDDD
jgi:hypothetical protein